ncbi:MAG: DUF2191 domain-containing protein [Candidatus Dormibacteraeota bacterium]|nr:DUF2191 domain-containing protein [Candidatus Dormibacteraeota bacterium]
MKTTVEIAEPLLSRAKEVAALRRTTLRALIEAGLRQVLGEPGTTPFTLRDASVGGQGMNPEFAEGSWERIREPAYDGRGA